MPKLSTLSNPTGLVDLEKTRIAVVIDESGKNQAFSLVRLDLEGLTLPTPLNVVVIARRGNSEQRIELGPASAWDRSFRQLAELSEEGSWTFRILLVQPGSAKLIGAAEHVRPNGQGNSESFIALEPADLGQRPWEIEVLEAEGRVVIRFNKDIYHSSGEAEADKFFIGMILPEAVRRLAKWIAERAGALEDPIWDSFKSWLALHGITGEPDEDSTQQQEEWCNEVVGAFCDRFEFATQIRELRIKGSEE